MTLTCHRFFGLLTHFGIPWHRIKEEKGRILGGYSQVCWFLMGTWYTTRCLYWTKNTLNYFPSWDSFPVCQPHPWCLECECSSLQWFAAAYKLSSSEEGWVLPCLHSSSFISRFHNDFSLRHGPALHFLISA